jgi:hypothetical protein
MALQGLAAAGRSTRVLAARSSRALTGALHRSGRHLPARFAGDESDSGEEGTAGVGGEKERAKETTRQAASRVWREALAAAEERAAQRDVLAGSGALPLRKARKEELPHFSEDEEEKEEGGAAPAAPQLVDAGPAGEGGSHIVVRNPLAAAAAEREAPALPGSVGGGEGLAASLFSMVNPLARPKPRGAPHAAAAAGGSATSVGSNPLQTAAAPAPAGGAQGASLFAPLFSRWKPQVVKPLAAAPPQGAEPAAQGAFQGVNPMRRGEAPAPVQASAGAAGARGNASVLTSARAPLEARAGDEAVVGFTENPLLAGKRREKKRRSSSRKSRE